MQTATVSSKFQIVIPAAVREAIALRPGERLAFVVKGRALHLVPIEPVAALRGLLRGANPDDLRDRPEAL